MRSFLYGAFWVAIYLAVSLAPLFVLLIGETPPGRGFWRELSVGLGFVGLSMMGLQFFLTGRFRQITSPYGIDVVYHFHRLVSLIAFSFILLHPIIIFLSAPSTVMFLDPLSSPWWMMTGTGGLLAFAIIIATSLHRLKLDITYENWRGVHGYAAVIAVALSMFHIAGVGYYVREPLKRWLWISMVIAWVLALAYVRIAKPFLMQRRPYVVEDVVKERGNSWTLVIKPDGHVGMTFRPGQFAWLTIGRSPFSIREHPFSFSSSAMRQGRIEMTIKELGDFTSGIGRTEPGTRAYIDGPYGTFTIDSHGAPGYVFIAGGVGITPIMSILRTMADRRDGRRLILLYGCRTWEEMTFREEIEELGKALNLRTVYVLQEPHEGWEGEQGVVTADVMARYMPVDRLHYEFFVCGPQPMQEAVKSALGSLGVPLERVQSESFNFV